MGNSAASFPCDPNGCADGLGGSGWAPEIPKSKFCLPRVLGSDRNERLLESTRTAQATQLRQEGGQLVQAGIYLTWHPSGTSLWGIGGSRHLRKRLCGV